MKINYQVFPGNIYSFAHNIFKTKKGDKEFVLSEWERDIDCVVVKKRWKKLDRKSDLVNPDDYLILQEKNTPKWIKFKYPFFKREKVIVVYK